MRVVRSNEPSTEPTPHQTGGAPAPPFLFPRHSIDRLTRLAAIAVLVAAPLFTLAFIAHFGVNGPDWDHLVASELFNRWHDGNLTFQNLYSQHNEHRPVIPRLVVLGLGSLTRFNNLAEMYLQWALIAWVAVLLCRAFARETGARWDPRTLVPIVILLFSIRQYEILIIGEGLLTYLSLAFFVTTIYWLVSRPASPFSLAVAIACAVCTSFCQSNGLLVWPIGLLAILSGLRVEGRRFGHAGAAVWTASAAIVFYAFFHNYSDPGNHPSWRFVLQYPKVAISYFLSVGGGPLAGELWSTVAMGIGMLLLEIAIVVAVVAEWWRSRTPIPLAMWLLACAVATQIMITLNRAGFGLGQALASRYSTYLGLAPIAVYWCAWRLRARWRPMGERLVTVVVTVVVVGWMSASIEGWFSAKDLRAVHQWHAYLLYTAKYQPPVLLKDLYPNPEHARLYSAGLERLGLNVFADDHVRPSALTLTSARPPFFVDIVNGKSGPTVKSLEVGADEAIVLDGWAMDPGMTAPAAAVFVTIDGGVDVPSMMAGDRPDLIAVFHNASARRAGFRASFSSSLLTPGAHRVALKIVAADRIHAFQSDPLFDVIRR